VSRDGPLEKALGLGILFLIHENGAEIQQPQNMIWIGGNACAKIGNCLRHIASLGGCGGF